jgi:hypothetical protein
MRQDYEIRPILDLIEDDEMYLKINEIYNTSRLSDFARPLESREVDLVKEIKNDKKKSFWTFQIKALYFFFLLNK